jgi:hypothetical protein
MSTRARAHEITNRGLFHEVAHVPCARHLLGRRISAGARFLVSWVRRSRSGQVRPTRAPRPGEWRTRVLRRPLRQPVTTPARGTWTRSSESAGGDPGDRSWSRHRGVICRISATCRGILALMAQRASRAAGTAPRVAAAGAGKGALVWVRAVSTGVSAMIRLVRSEPLRERVFDVVWPARSDAIGKFGGARSHCCPVGAAAPVSAAPESRRAGRRDGSVAAAGGRRTQRRPPGPPGGVPQEVLAYTVNAAAAGSRPSIWATVRCATATRRSTSLAARSR